MAQKHIIVGTMTFEISYEILNPTKNATAIFLHGWGSNKEIMKQAFGKTLPHHRHLYIDLPGFGKSDNASILDTHQYAEIIDHFLHALEISKDIIIGHSFGGKVATLLNPALLVLLSNSGIVVPKRLSVRLKIKLFKLLKPFGGASLFRFFASKDVEGMSPVMYETFKKVVDEDFSAIFANYSGKTLIFWGKEDAATPLSSGEKVASLIKNSAFFPLKGDHYFFLQHALFIEKAIEKELHGER